LRRRRLRVWGSSSLRAEALLEEGVEDDAEDHQPHNPDKVSKGRSPGIYYKEREREKGAGGPGGPGEEESVMTNFHEK